MFYVNYISIKKQKLKNTMWTTGLITEIKNVKKEDMIEFLN